MTLSEWLTLLAIVLGPLFGVWLARHMQDRAIYRERRMDIFRTLMRTRRTPMWPDHVGALNLVEIEFSEKGTLLTLGASCSNTSGPRTPADMMKRQQTA